MDTPVHKSARTGPEQGSTSSWCCVSQERKSYNSGHELIARKELGQGMYI